MATSRNERSRLPLPVAPMLASPDGGRLPDGPDNWYEFKYDGYRSIARVAPDGTMALTSRNGNDLTEEFAAVTGGLGDALDGRAAVFDGELVVLNEQLQPEFALMQERRGRYQQGLSVADRPVLYLVFDVLRLGDTTLVNEPYERRRQLLELLDLPRPELITVVPAFSHAALAADGLTPHDLLDRAADAGFEGLIAKRRSSRYHPGQRSLEWRKHPSVGLPNDHGQLQQSLLRSWRWIGLVSVRNRCRARTRWPPPCEVVRGGGGSNRTQVSPRDLQVVFRSFCRAGRLPTDGVPMCRSHVLSRRRTARPSAH